MISENAFVVLNKRYFLKDENGNVIEDWEKLCKRIAYAISLDEKTLELQKKWESIYFEILYNLRFVPNSPTLMNASKENQMLSACFVLGIEDNLPSIMKAATDAAMIHKSGGGTGFNFSKLRPAGSMVKSTTGVSSGPVSFMKMLNDITEQIKQGGTRRGANMGLLSVDHPDILKFIDCKSDTSQITNFNISVVVTNKFMEAVLNDGEYDLIDPHTKKKVKKLKARMVFEKICKNAHATGEPGLFFIDKANENQGEYLIEGTNPCIAEGQYVNTPNGVRKVETLKVGDIISTVIGEEPIKSIEKYTNYDIYKVKFCDGDYQLVTASHQYHTFLPTHNWKKVQLKAVNDLKPGDLIRVCPAPIKLEKTDERSYNIAILTGIMLGDGCYTEKVFNRKHIFIASNIEDVEYNHNIKILLNTLKIEYNQDEVDNNSKSLKIHISTNSNQDLLNLVNLTPAPSYEKQFNIEMVTNRNIAFGILNGLIATDGNIHLYGNSPMIRISTSSYELARQIRQLGLMCGAHGRIYQTKAAGKHGGCINGRKIVAAHNGYVVTFSNQSASILALNIECIHPEKNKKLKRLITEYSFSGNTWKTKIKEIVPAGTATVYDIYCEKSDTWITSGYVQRGCGEVPLRNHESCNLGSLNLSKYYKKRTHNNDDCWPEDIDISLLEKDIKTITRFLDSIISVNCYPLDEIRKATDETRKIGIGIMGLADLLILLGIPYGSEKSYEVAADIMKFIQNTANKYSEELGKEKGICPASEKMGIKRRNFWTTIIAPTGCQSGNTLIVSDDGILSLNEIGDINGNIWQNINLNVSQEFHYEKATKFYINGKAKTKTIKLKSGAELQATLNHKYRIIKNGEYIWEYVSNLTVGDKMVLSLGTYNKKTEVDFVDVENIHGNENNIILPKKSSPKLGKFLGIYFGDGSNHEKGIRIACNAKEKDYIKIVELCKELFNITPTIEDNKRNCLSICLNSKRLLRWMEVNNLIKQKSTKLYIPQIIRRFSRESLAAFVCGFYHADGSKSNSCIYVDSSCYDFIKQMMTIIRAIGYDCTIRTHISGFGTKMYRLYWIKSSKRKFNINDYEMLLSCGLWNCAIDSIDNIVDSECETFDIEVPINNTYVANGYISHNTISIIADASSGCEPLFSVGYIRTCMDNTKLKVLHPHLVELLGKKLTKELENKIISSPSIQEIEEIPKTIREIFVTSADVTPEQHVKMQATLQPYVHGGISKTINMPKEATIEDVEKAFILAYKLGCKGITVYRDGSRPNQVLAVAKEDDSKPKIKNRPKEVFGSTSRFTTPFGKLYLTINKIKKEDKEPIELFARLGKCGSNIQSLVDAISILCSLCFKHGVEAKHVAKALKGIKSEDYIFEGQEKYTSIADLIAKKLEEAINQKISLETKELIQECPECGEELTKEEGCVKCHSCGYSKC